MRIYSMTATFGKLNHQTLTLEPGLNVIEAPNEWGKSTWCAFLVAMFYGIDTHKRSSKAGMAAKERYAPWSGVPMSGRIELNWNGRDITIERNSTARTPFGDFRAYETATGLAVSELTATNCGQLLLGVEQSVFTRSGFIRLQDMPVTQDESLRRRLNNLVTTGDESDAGDQLGKKLKELQNNIRYNQNGLLPKAEAERNQIRNQLQLQEDLQAEIVRIQNRQQDLEKAQKLLNNHADALRYESAKQGIVRIQQAEESCNRIREELQILETECATLPQREEAEKALQQGNALLASERELDVQAKLLPPAPISPEIPAQFSGIPSHEAVETAKADYEQYKNLQAKKKNLGNIPLFFGIFAAIGLIGMVILHTTTAYLAIGLGLLAIGIPVLVVSVSGSAKAKAQLETLCTKYPGITPDGWTAYAQRYAQAAEKYNQDLAQYSLVAGNMQNRQDALRKDIESYAAGSTLSDTIQKWQSVLDKHQLFAAKTREYQNALEHMGALQSVATTAPEPGFEDALTFTQSETESRLQQCDFELRQLHIKLGQCMGQAESFGEIDSLKTRLDAINRRIYRLEEHYRALELARELLYQASASLQRRFAPRISKRAQDFFCHLTKGRYQRISLNDDLSILASAENEDTLRVTDFRSDGTVDQLYLSLRLAVAGEITPEAPLILDDALIRFDDDRLKAALELLQKEAAEKQVILFTCQGREKNLLG